MTTIEIITGRDLSDAYIERMNRQRILEYGENTKNFRKNELDSTFFFVYDREQLCAFGMLKPLTLTYDNTPVNILGIGNIIAIEKGKGYGRILMHRITDYLVDHQTIGLGFCDPDLSDFYAKCGYQVVEQLSARFRYLYAHQDGTREHLDHVPNVLCFDPDDALIDTLLAFDDLIYIDVPFW